MNKIYKSARQHQNRFALLGRLERNDRKRTKPALRRMQAKCL